MDPRVARCHLLAEVLSADGMMPDSERALLEETMETLGLSEAEREQVRTFDGAEGAAAALRDLPEADRQAILDDCVHGVLIDGRLAPLETAAIKRIATALGL
jgi:uncharacterized tellurite resistance protein B-like protein